MIILTRLDKSPILVNLETVKFIESTPDTLISFINGDTMMVLETLQEVESRVLEYRAEALRKVH